MRPKENAPSSPDDGDPPSVSLEVSQTKRQGWTLGDSGRLGEGQTPEPLLVTLGWIVVPIVVFLLLVSLFAV